MTTVFVSKRKRGAGIVTMIVPGPGTSVTAKAVKGAQVSISTWVQGELNNHATVKVLDTDVQSWIKTKYLPKSDDALTGVPDLSEATVELVKSVAQLKLEVDAALWNLVTYAETLVPDEESDMTQADVDALNELRRIVRATPA